MDIIRTKAELDAVMQDNLGVSLLPSVTYVEKCVCVCLCVCLRKKARGSSRLAKV